MEEKAKTPTRELSIAGVFIVFLYDKGDVEC